ncbi:MAG: hypothetical protein AAFY52_02810 [Pseudomonadota bacterium]
MKAKTSMVAAGAVTATVAFGTWMTGNRGLQFDAPDANAAVTQSVESADVPTLPQPSAADTRPVPLEDKLGRPIVFYAEGTLGEGFFETLRALDAETRAFDYDAKPVSLAEVDVYLLKAANWDSMRARANHVLHANIVANLNGQPDTLSFSWFQARLSSKDGTKSREVLVILANDQGLQTLSQFCTVLSIYDLLRHAHTGRALTQNTGTPVLRTDACRSAGWTSVADLP